MQDPEDTTTECEVVHPLWGGVWHLVKELNIIFSNYTLSYIPKRNEDVFRQKLAHECSQHHYSQVKTWRQPKCRSMDEGLTRDSIVV